MQIDPTSLLVLTALGALGAGALMLGAWLGWGRPKHLLIWAGAHILSGATITASLAAIFVGNANTFAPVAIAIAVIPALLWAGTREFLGLPIGWLGATAGPVLCVGVLGGAYLAGLQAERWIFLAICAAWPIYALAAACEPTVSRSSCLRSAPASGSCISKRFCS
jgi:hypothetical protein